MTAAVSDTVDHLFSGRGQNSVIDLSIGAPGPEILARLPGMFERTTQRRMEGERDTGNIFQYGPEQGLKSFRRNLASFLTAEYHDKVDEDELVVTTGATNGLFLTCSILLDRRAVVFVENPTYFIALKVLAQDLGFRIVSVPMKEDGIDWRALEASVLEHRTRFTGSTDRFWSMLYTIPNFHNPTGITFSVDTCQQILRIAGENEMLVLCDDVYNLLSYHQRPAFSRLKALDRHSLVISNGTFSKILTPGVRLGWLELPRRLVGRLTSSGVLLSGGSQNNYMSGLVSTLLEDGDIEANLAFLRGVYKERMSTACAYLAEHLPSTWSISDPGGGYFLWVRADVNLREFCARLEAEEGVSVLPGFRACSANTATEDFANCFRVSVAYYSRDQILDACRTICRLANSLFS